MEWGVVSTIKAPAAQVRAFVAHHLGLGAAHLWLCMDDPLDGLSLDHPQVTLIRCDDAHWARLAGRPDRHQNRQSKNARAVYQACRLDWLAHLDVDEFLWPPGLVGDLLAAVPARQPMLRAEPFEAMHDPGLPDDIFTARQFRGALRQAPLREAALGEYAGLLPLGLLSHAQGKAFFRTGIKGLSPRLHGAFLQGERLPGPPFARGLSVLHFHAQDRARWLAALPFRLTRGAYQYHPELQAFLSGASETEVAAFYERTQVLRADAAAMLRSEGRLVEAELALRAKVTALGLA